MDMVITDPTNWITKEATPHVNLPGIDDGETQVSETLAILEYLCEKYKADLMGRSEEEGANV